MISVADKEDRKAADFFNEYLFKIYGFKLPVKINLSGTVYGKQL
jgi:hypothetical protein